MARNFVSASSQRLSNGAAVLTATPITMACWFKSTTIAAAQSLICLTNNSDSAPQHEFRMDARGDVANDPIRATALDDVSVNSADTTAGYSADTWQHACAVFASSTSRAVYLNGGSKGTNTTSRTPTGLVRTGIGGIARPTPAFFMSGDIAEAAIWNVALADDEVLALARGWSPLFIRRSALRAYWPLWGNDSPEPDFRGGFSMTLTNTPTKSAHGKIFYPVSPFAVPVPAPPAAAPETFGFYRRRVG